MEDSLWVSLALLLVAVLFCEGLRWVVRGQLSGGYRSLATELVSTFQLCCCVHELRLLAERGASDPNFHLLLVYGVTLLNVLTFGGATCNPNTTLEQLLTGEASFGGSFQQLASQFGAALLARFTMNNVWAQKLSPLHSKGNLECQSGIHTGSMLFAAAVEAACAFVVQSSLLYLRGSKVKYQAQLLSAIIVLLVYAGGHITGAVFNQALAFSMYFHCKGNTLLEYVVVYWLGPIIGAPLS
ncbi:aquaporin-11 isoform X2 [Rhinatrema bivittatum]|uniref:aquaporin-11 isoform X2 n=1 Tax=Rhinatrema bivittatum TaxID=194408 RepID=UPI00112CDE01|nr:aquaporin-11 isoform X2 [Rhinatrema bivittatum]